MVPLKDVDEEPVNYLRWVANEDGDRYVVLMDGEQRDPTPINEDGYLERFFSALEACQC